MYRRVRRATPLATAATVGLTAIATMTLLGIVAQGSQGASLCPISGGRACPGQGGGYVYSTHYVGFSTTDPPCEQGTNEWAVYVSSSGTDPHVNQGPITGDSLYLWTYGGDASFGYGWAWALTTFVGDIRVTAFEGAYHWGDDWMWGGCQRGLWLVGRLTVEQPVAVEPQTWGRMKALYR